MPSKPSKFNVFISQTDDEHIVYNTLTGSISRVNDPLRKSLENDGAFGSTITENSDLTLAMNEQGIIVPEDTDESMIYQNLHNRWKEGKETVEINTLLTYDCNFECPYCYQGRGEKGASIHGFKYMTPELLAAVKNFIKNTIEERQARRLELIKNNLRTLGQGEVWWQWWEMVPGSLYTIGEAVRVARNTAAHVTTRKFSKAEVALLLAAMPTQLEMIISLTDFLKHLPSDVSTFKI